MQEWIRPRIGLGCKKTLTQARRLLRRERLYHVDMPRSIVDMDADPIALFLDELEMGALLQVCPILHIELDLQDWAHFSKCAQSCTSNLICSNSRMTSSRSLAFTSTIIIPPIQPRKSSRPLFFAYFCFDCTKLSEINCPFYGT